MVDVDGTLAGPYCAGQRVLRTSAPDALALLAGHAPVFLWSIAGADNGHRLLREFPQLGRHVAGAYGKQDLPLDLVDHPFAIDDEDLDDVVLRCRHVILAESFRGGDDPPDLLEAARTIGAWIQGLRSG